MIIVNIAGLALIVLIVWWFWLYKPQSQALDQEDSVIVVENGVYQPAHIRIPPGQPATLRFLRKDASPCAEMVQFPALNISEQLPLNKTRSLQLPALEQGVYEFHCQMQMYRGQLHVSDL
ncbi:MAG: plastocyanin [Alcanivorax sp.]|uniref:cupredoxin domain-containing protein n=1 Tax=unclassified Ketobacter TaxID=2639109 RepID=UPI000F236A4F|nr:MULTISPECIES: cupredoxin domain-containing protein [unclassified Ketobacter]MCK5790344.1 cupredoxin domain-containing protein [Ketobacter sp.]RLT91430.1 MAG: cupredoxin domain-containing protein [Ketobacter sp. GenoA1]RLT96290.1 MAG: cupredoxin domain-containing protein [Ketobacter sp.]TNC84833.1 MAG: plastocyanin [Alcanivorax sp.]